MNPTNKVIYYENLAKLNQSFEPAFREKFQAFLSKGWYILGEEVSRFEQAFAEPESFLSYTFHVIQSSLSPSPL